MRYQAYWISPRGRIIPLGGSTISHIAAVLKDPWTFGLSRQTILSTYRRHQEPLGFEGRARQEIMLKLLLKGWIRIRYRPRLHGFVVQTGRMTPGVVCRLRRWAGLVTSGGWDRLDPKGLMLEVLTDSKEDNCTIPLDLLLERK